jgi:CheY-like chemotaxis protein
VLINLPVVRNLVLPYGLFVDFASSANQAIQKIKFCMTQPEEEWYDAILMDYIMPDMNGVEATKIIRQLDFEYTKKVPIIACTTSLSGNEELFSANGINDFLLKPIEAEHLDAIIQKWINPSRLTERAYHHEHSLLSIPGIQTETVIQNVGCSVRSYKRILRMFCRTALERVLKIKESWKNDEYEDFAIRIHAFKGAAFSIGAQTIGDMAQELEDAAADRDEEFIEKKTGEFLEEALALVRNITETIRSTAEKIEEPINAAHVPFKKLKEALLSVDIEAINIFFKEYGNSFLDNEAANLISEIEHDILLFEYEKALEKINKRL